MMTALAQRIKETPMAPYMNLLRGMTREQKQIVVTFITESIEEADNAKTDEEIIREKYKNLKVAPELKRLRGCIKLTDEELKDERTQYILNR